MQAGLGCFVGSVLVKRDLEEDLMAHLTRLGFSCEVVQDQASRLRRAREFVAQARNGVGEEEGQGSCVKERSRQRKSW